MSDLHDDPRWNQEAGRVARELDHNDVRDAQEMMRRDLYQLQGDPHAQHEFINMVNRYDQKGYGADLLITRAPNGQEMWQITPANYGQYGYQENYYPAPPAQPLPMEPVPAPGVVVVQPENPGQRLVDGLATGAGVGLGLGIMHNIFDGGHRR